MRVGFAMSPRANETQLKDHQKGRDRFPLRIIIRTPPGGLDNRYKSITSWLDENCEIGGWLITPAGTSGVCCDAIAVYVTNPTCALAFIALWCLSADASGLYEFRR